MTSRRTFIAIDISEAARAECSRHIDELRGRFPEVRVGWGRAEKLHVTMKFLGDTSEEEIEKLQAGLTVIAGRYSPMALRLSMCGVFPSPRKPRILWVGMQGEVSLLEAIHSEMETLTSKLGFQAEDRRFRPHITIARVREPQSASALARTHVGADLHPIEFTVNDIVVYESKLQPSGSVYSKLMTVRLGGEGSVA